MSQTSASQECRLPVDLCDVRAQICKFSLSNGLNHLVMDGRYALGRRFEIYLVDHIAPVTQLLAGGEMLAFPSGSQGWFQQVGRFDITDDVRQFLLALLQGATLIDCRRNSQTMADDPVKFREFYRAVCRRFKAREPKSAAIIALWSGLLSPPAQPTS